MTLNRAQRHELERLIEAERRALAGVHEAQAARRLRALHDARRRLADGTYGTCAACGREIDLDRLIAHPAAERCLECQSRLEQDEPGRGRPGAEP